MNKLALIDGDSLLYIVCNPKTVYNEESKEYKKIDKTFEEVKEGLDSFIDNIIFAVGADNYVLALTTTKCFRYAINPEYKANRKGLTKPIWFNEAIGYLKSKKQAIWDEKYEADDIVISLKKQYPESVLCAIDKDVLYGIEGTHYNYKKNEFITVNSLEVDYKFWCSMVTGDTADGIKCLPNKGIKYAEKILNFTNTNSLFFRYYQEVVLAEYIAYYSEYQGIQEFYKNYMCLKIVDNLKIDLDKMKVIYE